MDKLVQPGATQALAFAASYTALLVLLGLGLAFRVVAIRRARRIGIGDGGDAMLARRIRAHGNFSEYAPILMVLLIGLALVGAPEWLVHLIGIPALLGRILHAIGLTRSASANWQRIGGMVLTIGAMATGAMALVVLAWR